MSPDRFRYRPLRASTSLMTSGNWLAALEFDLPAAELINGAVETFLAVRSRDGSHRLTAKVTTEGSPYDRRVQLVLAQWPPVAGAGLIARTSLPLRWLLGGHERVGDALLSALHDGYLQRALVAASAD